MYAIAWQWIFPSITLIIVLYFYFKHKYNYWNARGLKGPRPLWLFGNAFQFLANDHKTEYDNVQKFGKVYGTYFFLAPWLVVADPEVIQKLIVTDFRYFVNRVQTNVQHKIWDSTLFAAKFDDWKRLRSVIAPAFMPSKNRDTTTIMQINVDKFDNYLAMLCSTGSNVLDVKKVVSGFTLDVIASTSFATEINTNADSKNPFVVQGKKFVTLNTNKIAASVVLPKFLLKLIGIKTYLNIEPFNFFLDVCGQILLKRKKESELNRKDLIQILLEARANSGDFDRELKKILTEEHYDNRDQTSVANQKLTDLEVIANSAFLFLAAYDTASTAISMCFYELAKNQDIQKRLHNDLHQALHNLKKFSDEYYDTLLNNIPYFDAVIKETLRFYPPITTIFRMCNKDGYQLNDRVLLFKDQIVQISIPAIHFNPEYYKDPTRFNPERFLPENKHLLVPNTYLPFSTGPRNCIAIRYGLLEIKLGLAHILQKYKFSTTMNTPKELTFQKRTPLLVPDSFELNISKR